MLFLTMKTLPIPLKTHLYTHFSIMMKHILSLSLLAALAWPMSHQAQTKVDLKKYPDYQSSTAQPDAKLLRYGSRNTRGVKATPVSERPAYVNNAALKHFPPIFNQAGGSCGSASRIGYMFTHEINSYRDADASKMENQYPTHFVWLHTHGNSGKDEFVEFIGVPSAKTYGGQTYSNLFGFQEAHNNYFGWMTGYNKWFEAMNNRMHRPTRLPVSLQGEEGREALKNYLWNHNGDPDFKSGGIVGIGVASGGTWKNIPKTDANDEAGVTKMWYVADWGSQVDHALTIVGYDDRIEFDLDGNGKIGEKEKDEVGAWIVANSWGNWCNNGLIYCPYARAVPTNGRDANGNVQGWWEPEIYNVRKNYRPLRTLKVKMDYSHRSEIKLSVGIAANLKANRPEKTIELHHFRFAGDGGNGDVSPAPAMPMLGRWADGKEHSEPMEFGYDLTDLTAGYDVSQPLKYFFTIDSRTKSGMSSKALGSGTLHHLGILDYEFDQAGIESLFTLGEGGTMPITKGRLATYTTVVYGEQYTTPQNPSLNGNILTWEAPQPTGHVVKNYNVYADGELAGTTLEKQFTVSGKAGNYSVTATYDTGIESKRVGVTAPVAAQTTNVAVNLKGNGFIIPDVFKDQYEAATIEYLIKPNSLSNWNQEVGPGWGAFMMHANESGTFTAGWNTGSNRLDAYNALKVGKWTHVAVAINRNYFRLHIDGAPAQNLTSTSFVGLGGFGDLVFNGSTNANKNHNATYDEIRIWKVARPAANIKACTGVEFSGDLLPDGLLAYYKGDIIQIDGKPYLRDCVGGHHAPIIRSSADSYEQVNSDKELTPAAASNFYSSTTKITAPTTVVAGQPALFEAVYPDFTESLVWNAPEAGIKDLKASKVTMTFPQEGTYKVTMTATAGSNSFPAEKTVTVLPATAPTADFTASALEVPAGERVSFTPVTPIPGYIYEWSMPGATMTTSKAITAGTSYDKFGKYNVTLTVAAPNGTKATKTVEVTVREVAPEADFNLSEGVLLKGQSTTIQDASKFAPKSWQWIFASPGQVYTAGVASPKVAIDVPGVYDVTLTAKNDAGATTKTLPRGLIIVNADSKNGLSFNAASARVTPLRSPIEAGMADATIEWWANPSKLSDYCCGIGDADGRFFIKVNANGELLVNRGTLTLSSGANCVIPGEWHHYAVVIKKSTVTIYRDGKVFKKGSINGFAFTALSQFSIGSSAAEMSGQIDEFRVWGTALTDAKIQSYANAPIENVRDAAVQADVLLLYYDFNQTSGDVMDRSTTSNNGVRSGFGPEGDAWALSKGVFCLNFEATGQNVAATYLKNYKKAFRYNYTPVNNTTSGRWYELRDWTLENTVATADGKIVSGAHVDRDKEYSFTIATGWDGFPNLKDHKVYQTITLPAGAYTFSSAFHDNANLGRSDASRSYIAVARGKGLPNTADLDKQALSSKQMEQVGASAVNSVSFVLTEETEVSLGLVVNMSGSSIAMIKEFSLVRSELGTLVGLSGVEVDAKNLGSEAIYDLSGRRVFQPQSGQVYIQGGQRILVK